MYTAGDHAESARQDGAAIAPIWQMKRILGCAGAQVNEVDYEVDYEVDCGWKKMRSRVSDGALARGGTLGVCRFLALIQVPVCSL